ncbi:type III polyketide synthase [Alkalihalobacillus sp. BA299]|uniref:type III polyketide synthase n=1 Tax=Alkalihalobacillus sp. BA299 TaxID=2815938 RepID=UPI001ADD3378|nr:3-oxoacyl-[acyl-carrier-protein] synthase III C-terminal domain-containing protein [Alkalihalobacillus sp. BA299]
MPSILSVSTYNPPHTLPQGMTTEFAKELFTEDFQDIDRLLRAFQNGQIQQRNFAVPISWFDKDHSLGERNDLYIKLATEYGVKVIQRCLANLEFLIEPVDCSEIEAIFFVSSSGLSTPSIEARIMNHLPFSPRTKRIPIWGLGCAGGAAGISRAYEYCLAFPHAKVLVLCIELCSLTFQRNDRTKSNLIGTSLFGDGAACVMVGGEESQNPGKDLKPFVRGTHSCLMPNSEEVMGWDVKDSGLFVVFSRDIPTIVRNWLKPVVDEFLAQYELNIKDITHFIAHPGGKKVLDAYEDTLHINSDMTRHSRNVLKEHGNMSSPTVFYVLKEIMGIETKAGGLGLIGALGPGFCSELILVEWR